MEKERIAIGVDIGGTNIRAGAITPDGCIIGEPFSVATGATDPKELIVARIIESINVVIENNRLEKLNIQGIGLGVTGPLDVKNGTILQCPNLPTMDFFPLRETIENEFGLQVSMNNDANAMILGESLWGAGKGANSVLGITLGTGFGCAIVLDRKVMMGATETAGEIWISPYQDGIIEDVVSGNGISILYEKLTGQKLTSRDVAASALSGDIQAKLAWIKFGKAVAYALAWSVNLIDPDVVIIGGSMANSMDLFYPIMNETLRKNICPVPAQKLRIVKAQLGDNAGFIGAAALVF